MVDLILCSMKRSVAYRCTVCFASPHIGPEENFKQLWELVHDIPAGHHTPHGAFSSRGPVQRRRRCEAGLRRSRQMVPAGAGHKAIPKHKTTSVPCMEKEQVSSKTTLKPSFGTCVLLSKASYAQCNLGKKFLDGNVNIL